MKYKIVEVDKDYHVVSETFFRDFDTIEEAEEYCRKSGGGGYAYYVVEKTE